MTIDLFFVYLREGVIALSAFLLIRCSQSVLDAELSLHWNI